MAIFPTGIPILEIEPEGATILIFIRSKINELIGTESGKLSKNKIKNISVKFLFNVVLFLINGLKFEKNNENEPNIKIVIKLISLMQKINPNNIEIIINLELLLLFNT